MTRLNNEVTRIEPADTFLAVPTSCVEFGYRMAEQALEVDLRSETQFLARYDRIVKAVDERFDGNRRCP